MVPTTPTKEQRDAQPGGGGGCNDGGPAAPPAEADRGRGASSRTSPSGMTATCSEDPPPRGSLPRGCPRGCPRLSPRPPRAQRLTAAPRRRSGRITARRAPPGQRRRKRARAPPRAALTFLLVSPPRPHPRPRPTCGACAGLPQGRAPAEVSRSTAPLLRACAPAPLPW